MIINSQLNLKNSLYTSLLICAVSFTSVSFANQVIQENIQNETSELVQFSDAQLEQMLAPIALYPDTLLTHILIAATYPIEVIDADRFVKSHSTYSDQQLVEKAEDKEWDPSVRALLAFPRILENLSNDLGWMRKLGDAFLHDESSVLASIQALRNKADEAGNLTQMDNVEIVREKRTIIIESAQPEVIYVPYYDARTVYGNWHWSHYPPVYWHRPAHYAYHHGPFYWPSATYVAFDFFFSAFHWNDRYVVRHHHKKRYHHSNRRISTSHHAKRWHHDTTHRRGVAYRSKKVKHRYNSIRPAVSHSKERRVEHKDRRYVNNSYRDSNSRNKRVDSSVTMNKHQNFNNRLKVNHAVKLESKNNVGKNRVRLHQDKAINNKSYTRVKADFKEDKPLKHQRLLVKKPESKKNTVFSHDMWKKQQKIEVKNIERNEKVRVKSKDKEHQSKPKSYKSQGSRSNRSQNRVVSNNSSRSKPTSHKSRKHYN